VAIFALPGMNTALLQSVAQGNEGDYLMAARTSFLWGLVGVPVLAILGIFYYVDHPSISLGFFVAAIFFPFFYPLNLWDGFFQAKKLFRFSAVFSVFQSLTSTVSLVVAIYFFKASLGGMLMAYMAPFAILNILFFYKSLSLVSNDKRDNETISFGYFISKLSLLGVVASNLDKVVIGAFISMEALGLYVVATLFVVQVFELTKAVLSVAVPKIAAGVDISRRNYFLLVLISLTVIPALIFGFWMILKIFYPDQFFGSLIYFVAGIIFLPFFSISVPYNFQVIFSRNRKMIAWNAIIFHALRIALIPLTAVFFGPVGLAFLVGFQHLLFLIVTFLLKRYTRVA
jgi:O-antigen/teichoic acid export membrane protein